MLTVAIKDPIALSMGLPTSGRQTPRKGAVTLPSSSRGEQWVVFVPFILNVSKAFILAEE